MMTSGKTAIHVVSFSSFIILLCLCVLPVTSQLTKVNVTGYYITSSFDDKIYDGGDLEADCNTLSSSSTLRLCLNNILPPQRLLDGITAEGQPFNSDEFIGWTSDDVLLILQFPDAFITRVDIFFYNNPSEGIGLPPLETRATQSSGSLDFDNLGTPISVAFTNNSHLTQSDDSITSVSIAVDSFADGQFSFPYSRLRLIFNSSATNLSTTYISEVRLFNDSQGGVPNFTDIEFLTQVDQSIVYGIDNDIPSSVELSCTVINNGSFSYTWTGPNGETVMDSSVTRIYSADTSRTSILRISQLSLMDNGTYTCEASYSFFERPGITLPEARSNTISMSLQGSVVTSDMVLASVGDDSVDLHCTFTGYLPATYTVIWRINGGDVIEDSTDGYNITTSLSGSGRSNIGGQTIDSGVTTILTITLVEQFDLGMQYTCEMEGTNIIGTIQLLERPVPSTSTSTSSSSSITNPTTTTSTVTTSSTPVPSSPTSDSPNAIAAIAGGVAGGIIIIILVAVVLVILLLVFLLRERKKSSMSINSYPALADSLYTDIQKPSPPPLPDRLLNDGYTAINLPDDDFDHYPMKDTRMSPPVQNGAHLQPTKISSRPDFLQPNPMYTSRENIADSNLHVAGSLAFLDKMNENDVNDSSMFNIYAEPSVAPSIPSYNGTPDPMGSVFSEDDLNPAVFRSAVLDGNEDLYQIYRSVYSNPQPLQRSEVLLEVKDKNIRKLKDLGVGQFGEVELAHTVGLSLKQLRLSESNNDPGVSLVVAVKRLKSEADDSMREAFENEIKFMARLNHENVVRLLGVCLSKNAFIMMEYMEEGDLNNYLKALKFVTVDTYPLPDGTVDVAVLVYMCLQVAAGMRYLAGLRYIHRDLATRNVLVGQDFKVKIADFGMSQQLYSSFYYRVKGRAVLPIRWMANECFYGRFSEKTDVWSYGVLMWETFTLCRQQPYESFTDQELIDDAIQGDKRTLLSRPDTCPEEVYHVMLRCWSTDPDTRANFEEVHGLLLQIHAYNQDI